MGETSFGHWETEVMTPGAYRAEVVFLEGTPEAGTAYIRVGDATASQPLPARQTHVAFDLPSLPVGPGRVEAWAATPKRVAPPLFVNISKSDEPSPQS